RLAGATGSLPKERDDAISTIRPIWVSDSDGQLLTHCPHQSQIHASPYQQRRVSDQGRVDRFALRRATTPIRISGRRVLGGPIWLAWIFVVLDVACGADRDRRR